MKARGWYKGKGAHKPEVQVRITNVVSAAWGARIVVANSESGSRDCFTLTLDATEAKWLARELLDRIDEPRAVTPTGEATK